MPVQILLRKVIHNLHGHANRLLYMSRTDGGLQLKRLSDQCQLAKYSLLHRSIHADSTSRACMDNLLMRNARRQGKGLSSMHTSLGSSGLEPTLWADSLVDWFGCNGLRLTKGGSTRASSDSEIAYLCMESKAEQSKLAKSIKAGVCTLGDLVCDD